MVIRAISVRPISGGQVCWLLLAFLLSFWAYPHWAQAADPQTVEVNGFLSASNLPLWAGQEKGFFRDQAMTPVLTHPSGSVDQIKGLIEDRYPILLTAFDNVVAYRRGQGAPGIGAIPDFFAIAGIDNGLVTLIASPDIRNVPALKKRVLAVDALDTGFSFALKGILSGAGIDPASLQYIAVGSSAGRWKALREGRAQGAVLSLPADLVAGEQGFNTLTSVADALGPYLGNVVAVRQGWVRQNRPLLARFLQAYLRSISWTVAPANREEAIMILRREMPELTPSVAARIYERLTDPMKGLYRDMKLDPAGAQAVLDLRARYGPAWADHDTASTYLDASVLEQARQPSPAK